MKRAVHARRPTFVAGKPAGHLVGEPWCGAKSTRTDTTDRVTCERCIRLLTKRVWIAR